MKTEFLCKIKLHPFDHITLSEERGNLLGTIFSSGLKHSVHSCEY